MTSAEIAVAIVSYNTADLLRRCLETVLEDEGRRVLVVDSASSDGSGEMVRRGFPQVDLVAMATNRGYGAAANLALAALATPYVLLLNADTIVTRGGPDALARYLERHPAVAVAGPRIVGEHGAHEPSAHRFPAPGALLLQESGLRRRLRAGRHDPDEPRSVDWVLGAALAIRKAAFDSVGGFDESYFMYQEEVDLCFRLRQAGWAVTYAPVATIVHIGGASTTQSEADMMARYARSTVRFARTHLSRSAAVRVGIVLQLVLRARIARDLLVARCHRGSAAGQRAERQLRAWRQALTALREPG